MVMFRMYYLGLAPYETARHFLGLSETNWVQWSEEIRRRGGAEKGCRRRGQSGRIRAGRAGVIATPPARTPAAGP